jgi:hypothetical protein
MTMADTELLTRWQGWIASNIGGDAARRNAAYEAAAHAIDRRKSSAEIVAAAEGAALAYDVLTRAGRTAPAGPSPEPPAHAPAPVAPAPAPTSHGGILDIIAADKSANGAATFAALQAIERRQSFRAKAFFATRHFRGQYGFLGPDKGAIVRRWLVMLALVLLALAPLLDGSSRRSLPGFAIAVVMGLALLRLAQVLLFTTWLAHRAQLEIAKGRILVTHGVLGMRQIPVEVHWIREVTVSASLLQQLLGECTIHVDIDSPNRAVYQLHLPGVVRPQEATQFVDALRNAAQKVRQGNYYAKGFIA